MNKNKLPTYTDVDRYYKYTVFNDKKAAYTNTLQHIKLIWNRALIPVMYD